MLKIALAQMEVVAGRPDLNAKKMLQFIQQAKEATADLILFPEMSIPGYLLGDTWEQSAFLRDCEAWGEEIARAADTICVLFGNIAVDWRKVGDDGRVRKYNAFFAAQNGEFRGKDTFPYPFRIKTLQPNYREFDDDRHFYSLRKLAQELNIPVNELLQPFTLQIGERTLKIGGLLCEDGWSDDYSIKPVAALNRNGPVDLFVNLSSSPFTLGKNDKRHRVFSRQATEARVPLIYVNNIGIQNNGKTVYTFDGCSTAYGIQGDTLLQCAPFEEQLAFISLEKLQTESAESPIAVSNDRGFDSIFACLQYGIQHFLAQTGLSKIVIGVSGGIDSAVAAALYAHILKPENVLLVNMPSQYNSPTTINLARRLAENIGCRYIDVPINESVALTVRQMEASALPLSSFMRENVQARDRSSRILAAAAAAFGGAFTCNANKSELTVGYCTLYGDEAGFLAALADLWKHQVYELGHWLNDHVYKTPVIPAEVFSIVPSAELSHDQDVDAGKGDPLIYPYHDFLFRAFVERWQRATPEDLLTWYAEGTVESNIGCAPGLIAKTFPTAEEFIADLERWWRLYTGMGVAKRIQAPPVLAVSRRAFGFDHREAQNSVFFTRQYQQLKRRLLNMNENNGENDHV
ncbi:MAG TPA: NAD(+) synthase [Negativicutes bacterium]|nr:NAD(+) synthase [Negativicutes bacterium]